jgi:hypothetical protein
MSRITRDKVGRKVYDWSIGTVFKIGGGVLSEAFEQSAPIRNLIGHVAVGAAGKAGEVAGAAVEKVLDLRTKAEDQGDEKEQTDVEDTR